MRSFLKRFLRARRGESPQSGFDYVIPATEWVKGKEMEEALQIKNAEIAKHLSLPLVKLHCSMLAEDAIKAAIKDYKTKHGKESGSSSASPADKAT